jgi:hypothetical protein
MTWERNRLLGGPVIAAGALALFRRHARLGFASRLPVRQARHFVRATACRNPFPLPAP